MPAKTEHETVASEATTKSFLETTPLRSYLNPDSLSSQLKSTLDANMSQLSHASYDPLRAFGILKCECIFVFSGFNDHKIIECEVFNTVS